MKSLSQWTSKLLAERQPSTFQEILIVSAFLAGLLIFFWWKSLMPGMIMSSAGSVLDTPFYSSQSEKGLNLPTNAVLFDQVYQFTPWRFLIWQSFHQGEIPLWNHLSHSGTPLLATMQAAIAYPINLVLLLFPFQKSFVLSGMIRLFIAGLSTYVLAREYKLRWLSAMIASLSFMFSGFLIVWLGHPHTNVAVFFPMMIFLAEKIITTNNPSRIIRYTILLSLVVFFEVTGGHIETFFDLTFAATLYLMIRWLQVIWPSDETIRNKLKLLIGYTSALIFGVLISAVQLLPFIEWMNSSSVFFTRQSRGFQLINTNFIKQLLSLPVIIFPNIYNNPTWDYKYWSFLLNYSNYNEMILYVGTIPLLLAVLSLVKIEKEDKNIIFAWLIIGIVCLARAFNMPVIGWINDLPIFRLANPARLRLIASFSVCILSGYGAQNILNIQSPSFILLKRWWKILAVFIIIFGLIIMVLGNLILPFAVPGIQNYAYNQVYDEYSKRESHSNPIDYYYEQSDQMIRGLQAAFKFTNIEMYYPIYWSLLGLLIVIIGTKFTRSSQILGAALLVIVILDLYTFGHRLNPSIPEEYFFPNTAVSEVISKDRGIFRVSFTRQDLIPDAHIFYNFSDIRGLDFLTQNYQDYLELVGEERLSWVSYGSIFSSFQSPLLKVLNLKYIGSSSLEILAQDPEMEFLGNFDGFYLGRLKEPKSRGFIVYLADQFMSDEEIKKLLKKNPAQVYQKVFLSFDGVKAQSLKETPYMPSNSVQVISYKANSSSWQIETSYDGYLFVGDSYYPGWNAYLDGNHVPIYRTNLAFRSVFIPHGKHQLEFKFEPLSFRIGLIVTIVLLIISFIIILNPVPKLNHFSERN